MMKHMKLTMRSYRWLAVAGLALGGCGLATTPPVTVTIKPAEQGAAPAVAVTDTKAATPGKATAPASGTGDLIGTVLFDGASPTLPPLIMQGADVKDKAVCSAMTIPDETLLVDPAGKGIQNVFVFLEKPPAGATAVPPPEKQIFDQAGCRFLPHAMIVRTKVPLMVLSDDAVGHNTHTNPVRNSSINGAVGAKDRVGVLKVIYTLAEKAPIKVTCDVHPWMGAYQLPIDHGFAAVSNEQGEFQIKGLPAGSYTFKVWHETGKDLDRGYKVTIKPGENRVELKYGAAKFGK